MNGETSTQGIWGSGLAHALGAHAVWGSMPLYLILVHSVPALEFVAWRLVFTLPLCLAIIAWRSSFAELGTVLRDGRAMLTLLGSSAMIGINWYLYVFAIQSGNVYAASLGYYILPLTMMLLGLVFLKERLTRLQWGAVALASVGVSALAAGALTTMWLSLSMATTFGIYGLLRKTVAAGPLVGLTVESMILLPVALGIVGWFWSGPQGTAMAQSLGTSLAVAGSGPMTAVPLLLFATAARRMPYTVIGFLQFISPTIVFLMGLFIFGQELKPAQLACFVAIWAAASLFTWGLFRGEKPAPADEAASRGAGD
ncbi:EamA family transporter RarD [Alteraurantiacibacter aquimixticola]|uniref:EamA family transporter RarD n=1 Tax=Alteraurantiacibacter aquimixticola TaxID=2489173 RepID=A0A4T3F0G3_9SPHN|nr:EamA family transporter RarD [Alteraurantiacibacter aquimixticola]TIX50551.1 EamA family transporter RarD [Alteraurantiacibacter aquimixticola]